MNTITIVLVAGLVVAIPNVPRRAPSSSAAEWRQIRAERAAAAAMRAESVRHIKWLKEQIRLNAEQAAREKENREARKQNPRGRYYDGILKPSDPAKTPPK